jgi:hypothetical protein
MVTTSKYTRFAIIILSLGAVIGATELASAGIRRGPVPGPIGIRPGPIGIRPGPIGIVRPGPIGIVPVRPIPRPGIPGPIGIPTMVTPGTQTQL